MKMSSDKKPLEGAVPTGEEKATESSEQIKAEQPTERNKASEKAESSEKKDSKKSAKKKKEKPKLTEKQKTIRAIRRLIVKIVLVAATAAVLLTVVGSVAVSHDNNMFPAVGDGDLLITYKLGGYYNADIVVYEIDGIKRIGRVVGIPGDVIEINDETGYYTINGAMPYETIYYATRQATGSTVRFPYTVQEGEVFIFNDMRDDTYDSRMFGGIKTDKLQGKVVLLIRRRGF